MKKHWTEKALVPSLLSLLVISAFIFTGVISLEMQYQHVEYKGNGVYEAYNNVSETQRTTYTGTVDKKDRWNGYTTIVHYDSDPYKYSPDQKGVRRTTEGVMMNHGKREGKSTMTYEYDDGTSETKVQCCYVNGVWKYKPSAAKSASAEVSSFQLLRDTYPWYLVQLLAFNYDSTYVESYLNKMDSILNTHIYGDTLFFDFYDDAIAQLEETPYDSIVVLQSTLTFQLGIEELKNHEYRQAVIDRFWAGEGSSYDMVQTSYEPYLLYMNELGVSNPEFEQFCHVVDSTMDSYTALDPLDPFFTDSIDNYLYAAISEILEGEEDTSTVKSTLNRGAVPLAELLRFSTSINDIALTKSYAVADGRTAEVAEIVVTSMYLLMMEGDIIMKVAEQAWLENQSLVTLPKVATELEEHTSATSVSLHGYIIDDGGAEITASGIVWAAYYNPSLDDNSVNAAPGSDDFILTLEGLNEGTTYYARTYAINSAGTAYGNSIEFIAKNTTGIKPDRENLRLSIYPNPSKGMTSFRVFSPVQGPYSLILTDLKGSNVFEHALQLIPGENVIQVDLSQITAGTYLGQVRSGSEILASKKLIVME